MQNSNFKSSESTICPHSETLMDITGSEEVCTSCGLVMEERMTLQTPNNQYCMDNSWTEKVRHEIEDLCELVNIPKMYVEETLCILKKVQTDLRYDGHLYLFKEIELIVFSLYELTKLFDIGITPYDLSYFGNIKTTQIWNIEKRLGEFNTSPHCASSFAPKACYLLNLGYKHQRRIEEICRCMFGFGHFRPLNVLGCVINLYCKKHNIPISLRKICQTLNCNASSVAKIINLLGSKIDTVTSLHE